MSSPAAIKYQRECNKARILRKTATDLRLRPISRQETQVYYHSALTAFVAAWDAYINELICIFFNETANPLDIQYHAVHSIAETACS